jgi:transcriptional regulator with XRE-family HTH domain
MRASSTLREVGGTSLGQGLTQAQLAESLGVSQQQVASFEVGRRRVPVSLLPTLARALAVSVETLLGQPPKAGKRGPAPKLQQHLERITQLPRAKQRFVLEMLETVLQQASR